MVVQKSCQQIIGRCDGMKITGKMQIQFIHGYYLCVTAAGSSTGNESNTNGIASQ